ncbi:Nitrogen permease regulator 3 protein, partial [Trichostrongylus colubriformis]
RESAVNTPFELKVDNVRFAGHPKKLATTSEGSLTIFNVVFVLPASVDSHLVESFQLLIKKLALAIDSLQTQRGYFAEQERLMRSALDELEAEVSSRPESDQSLLDIPWDTIRRKSALAELLTKVFLDVGRTGVVQVFVDNFIEVGFCVQSRAFAHAHLTPKNRTEIDRIVKRIRLYHGILLLEDVWPSPDANPSVTLLLKHCEPDRSILDMSTASGIPLLQVFLIVRHLLLWARAVVIYPLCNTNVYASATYP